ncbi:MAG: indolepyruvate oxidoreductase subunit beta family protein [Ancalomicrobiaceae bacterium]|nr:indolepyruvate oxidoreductase subunit beta family protein [Ancalomicrobiaceae bacterium]
MTAPLIDRSTLSADRPLTIAILAMGGQGGGVLSDWIVALAETKGWMAQSTSVPGVAQRTGATIYYIEMIAAQDGRRPVLALMPTPGDVDIVLAAELMEAGRSVLRGLVTPDKTTLIASTHRSYAVVEKERPGDGTGDPTAVIDATDFAAKRTIAFDMDALAAKSGSVVSATLFGALAAARVLPFGRDDFEATIKSGGKGIEPSLAAFRAAYERTVTPKPEAVTRTPPKRLDPLPQMAGHAVLDALLTRIRTELPAEAQTMAFAGVKKLVDYQDPAYAGEYLDLLARLFGEDRAAGGATKAHAFTLAAAKYLAVAMAYDDPIRVADLKIRSNRLGRIRGEVGAKPEQIVYTTEYMHPRMEEVCGTLPKALGSWIESRPKLFDWLDRRVNKGRRVRPGTLLWFLGLSLVAGRRSGRRGTLRHAREMAHRDAWIAKAVETLRANYDLGVEVVATRRLIKGYSDTHVRGTSKFDRVLSALPLLLPRDDGAAWLRRLRQAALLDEAGTALDGALKTVATL